MALSSGQRLELLHIAGENATKLLEALQREVSTVRGFSEGERVFNNGRAAKAFSWWPDCRHAGLDLSLKAICAGGDFAHLWWFEHQRRLFQVSTGQCGSEEAQSGYHAAPGLRHSIEPGAWRTFTAAVSGIPGLDALPLARVISI